MPRLRRGTFAFLVLYAFVGANCSEQDYAESLNAPSLVSRRVVPSASSAVAPLLSVPVNVSRSADWSRNPEIAVDGAARRCIVVMRSPPPPIWPRA